MKPTRGPTIAALIEAGAGTVLLLAALIVALIAANWTAVFWLVTVGAACVGHAVTFGCGLLRGPYFWSASRGQRPRGR